MVLAGALQKARSVSSIFADAGPVGIALGVIIAMLFLLFISIVVYVLTCGCCTCWCNARYRRCCCPISSPRRAKLDPTVKELLCSVFGPKDSTYILEIFSCNLPAEGVAWTVAGFTDPNNSAALLQKPFSIPKLKVS